MKANELIEESYELYLAAEVGIEVGIDRNEFLKRANEIQKMVNTEAPIAEIREKVNQLQALIKNKAITSNSTDMNK